MALASKIVVLLILSGAVPEGLRIRMGCIREQACDSAGDKKNHAAGFGQSEPFVEVSSGVGHAPDGTRLIFRDYKTADGTGADIALGTFASPALAKAQLHRWLELPHKPTKVEDKVDPSGKVIGERVVASFKDVDGKDVTKVIWTEGSEYFEIGSLSLSTALNLEKWIRPPHPPLV
jgi:hypothetical protein